MSLFKYNEVELEIRMSDANFQKKYELAFKKMQETEISLQKVGMLSEITEKYCKMFYQLFDDIYGEGTGNKLFEGRLDEEEISEVFDSWLNQCKKDVDAINKKRAARYGKYKVGKKR